MHRLPVHQEERFTRRLRLATCALLAFAAAASAADKTLAFEVASVKPTHGDSPGGGIRAMPGGQTYLATGATLRLMIMLMYKVSDRQLAGGPSWMNFDRWDVNAKAERPSSLDQLHQMFQTLLADRFQLRFHTETREMTAYVLTLDKSGSKMKRNPSPEPFDFPLKPTGPGKFVPNHLDMKYFCWWLGQPLQAPVVNQTGLDGFYDFTLEVPPPENGRPDPSDTFAAMREQLGLKMEMRKAPVAVMVIDRAERPGEN
jgi:uncharacterized protein (TIGR03435 family)